MSKQYELLCTFPGTFGEDELPGKVALVEQAVADAGATNVSIEDMGKSRLAYPMKHIRYGYFYLVTFSVEPESVVNIQQKLRLIPDLLRGIIHLYNPRTKVTLEERQVQMKELKELATQQKVAPKKTYEKKEGKEVKKVEVKDPVSVKVASDKPVSTTVAPDKPVSPAVEPKKEEAPVVEEKAAEPKVEVKEEKPTPEPEVVLKKEEEKKDTSKVDMDDIDKKLDEILDQSIANI